MEVVQDQDILIEQSSNYTFSGSIIYYASIECSIRVVTEPTNKLALLWNFFQIYLCLCIQ